MIPKFRAWDKEFKEMVQVNALVLDEQVIKTTYKNGNVVKEDMKNYELMQSTGLFDKNGKEIYEGDVVQFEDCSKVSNFFYISTGIIEWYQCSFHLTNGNSVSMEDLVDGDLLDVTIIGNVWEDGDLIDGKKTS